MKPISSTTELKDAIRALQYNQAMQMQLIKENFNVLYEHIKPLNLLKNTYNDFSTSVNWRDSIFNSAIGMAAGFLVRRYLVPRPENIFKRFYGFIIQTLITNYISHHPGKIKTIILQLLNRISSKRKTVVSTL